MKTKHIFLSGIFFFLFYFVVNGQNPATKPYNDKQNMNVITQQEAHYPGGDEALYKYLNTNIKFSAEAKAKNFVGKTSVSIDVMPDSTLQNIVLLNNLGYGIDEEVVRLLKPLKFAPSIQNGTLLRMNVIMDIPIMAR